jgi:hypothetical protein
MIGSQRLRQPVAAWVILMAFTIRQQVDQGQKAKELSGSD